jgi:protein-S-isoprenylcysteine O-methyltransferase Ste14
MDHFEAVVKQLGGWLALAALVSIYVGIWQGIQNTPGRTTGRSPGWQRSTIFYVVTSLVFFGVCFLFWKPLPIHLSLFAEKVVLFTGIILYYPGMFLILWGRLALGHMYFVSTGFGAQLFEDHLLITSGPFAIIRHPMYTGITIAVIGGLLLYQTWTMFILLLLPFGFIRRARMEEKALATEFGEQWQEYSRHVPAFLPRIKGSPNGKN